MSRTIRLSAGPVAATAQLNSTPTADRIWEALPLDAAASTWGGEIYFTIPVEMGEDQAQETVARGDLGYWPPGPAFCIFFGPTPMSRGDEIRPASPVNVFGKLEGDATEFRAVSAGTRVLVERAE